MQPQWQKLKAQLLADKRKLGVMLCLGAVALLMWGRLLIAHDPSKALASVQPVTPVTGSPDNPTAVTTAADIPDHAVTVPQASSLKRDLFAFNPSGYRSAKDTNFGSIQAKSSHKQTDVRERLADVRQAAAGLTLQSVMTGEQPRAVIDGKMIGIGDTIHGFTLKKVLDRQVVLEMDGIVVRLGM